jgi:hypothetical protein
MHGWQISVVALAGFGLGCDSDDPRAGIDQNDVADGLGEVGSDGSVAGEGCLTDFDCEGMLEDLDECEVALCHTSTGRCLVAEAEDLARCEDFDPCTRASFCRSGVCEAFPSDTVDCDDGDPCTSDTCDETGACTHAPVSTGPCAEQPSCGDGVCDQGESCPADCNGGNNNFGCGDGQCDPNTFESVWCPQDCGGGNGGNNTGCGDGQCDQATYDSISCPQD